MRITDILAKYGVPTRDHGQHHHVSTGWVGVDCPYCSPGSGRFRAAFGPGGRAVNCWTCGKLPLFKTIRELTGIPADELHRLLGSLRASDRPQGPGRRREVLLPVGVGPLLPPHRRYLRGRGFDPDGLVKLWGLGGIGIAARLAWRIFVPIHLGGRVVSWTTRALADDVKYRYVTASAGEEAVPSRELLYGADYVRHAAVIVEGPTDAWRVGPGAAATLGVSYTAAQFERMTRFPVRVVCFDSESAAQGRARKLADDLSVFPGKTYRVELDAEDPGSAPAREIDRLRRLFLE